MPEPDALLRSNARRRRRRWQGASEDNVEIATAPSACQAASGTCVDNVEGIGSFWHVTDWHVNQFEPPSPNPCDMCRSSLTSGSACKERAGPFGHPDCDPSRASWEEALVMMQRVQPAPDFIMAGGDWIGHISEHRMGAQSVLAAAVLLVQLLSKHFSNVVSVHTIGNHDTWPYYSLAPAFANWDRAFLRSQGSEWMGVNFPEGARTEWQTHGYYARRLSSRLWAVSLNTNELAKTDGSTQ